MSELSDDQSKITQQGGSNIVESCLDARQAFQNILIHGVGQAQFGI